MSPRDLPTRRASPRRAFGVLAVVSLGLVAGCGDDGGGAGEAFCEAGDRLRSDIADLAGLDVVTGGTEALGERFASIRSDVDDLRDAGSDVAVDELDALDTAIDELGAAVAALGDSPGVDAAQAVVAGVGDVLEAAAAVVDRLDSACE